MCCKLSVYCETFIWQDKTNEQFKITTIYTPGLGQVVESERNENEREKITDKVKF